MTDRDRIFESALQLADYLCSFTMAGQISISTQAIDSSKAMLTASGLDVQGVNVIAPSDEKLLMNFMTSVDPVDEIEKINIEKLSMKLGISKAQLYRRVKKLSGHSPNELIQEIKLRKAFRLIREKFGNVAEIAFASGFNSPSYFSKSFQSRFGRLPAKVLKSV